MGVDLSRQAQQDFMQKVYLRGYSLETHTLDSFWEKTQRAGKETEVIVADTRGGFRTYSPMRSTPVLYREFAGLDSTDDTAIMSFVTEYGFLTENDSNAYGHRTIYRDCEPKLINGIPCREALHDWYEPLSQARGHIEDMEHAVLLMETIRRRNPYELSLVLWGGKYTLPDEYKLFIPMGNDADGAFLIHERRYTTPSLMERAKSLRTTGWTPPELQVLLELAHDQLSGEISVGLVRAVRTFIDCSSPLNPKLKMQPRNLLGAMYLQLAQEYTGDRMFRKCLVCDKWFEAGNEYTATSAQKTYCSDACRQKAYRRRKRSGEVVSKSGEPQEQSI